MLWVKIWYWIGRQAVSWQKATASRLSFEVEGKSFWAESVKEYDQEEAEKLAEELIGKTLIVTEQTEEQAKINPPLLPDLGDLQKFTSRSFKWSAQKTLKILQKLYENALITYLELTHATCLRI